MTASPCPSGYQGTSPNCAQIASLPGQFTPIAVPTATALPALAGYGGTIYIPAANPSSNVQMQLSLANPTSVGFSFARRATKVRIAQSGTNTALIYITLTASAGPVTFTGNPGFPGFQITLPSSGSAGDGPFYLAQLQNTGWTTVAGPATSSGGAVTLQPNLPVLALSPSQPAYFVVYTGGVVPSVAPSSSPGGQPTSSASTGPTPSSPGAPTSSASPVTSPSGGGSIPPTATPSARTSPTSFPTTTPTASPTPVSGSGSIPTSLAISGLPSGTAGTPISFAEGTFSLSVLNSSNVPISGTFANPVTVRSSDTTGAVQLSVNGTPATSVTVGSSSQVPFIAIVYTGAAVNPVTITASATTVANNAIATFAPTIQDIAYTAPSNVPSTCTDICLYAPAGGGAGSTYTFTATQAGYTGSPYNQTLLLTGASTCSSFATVTQSGTTFTVNAIASPTPGTCNVVIDGFGSTSLTVTISYTTFGVTLH